MVKLLLWLTTTLARLCLVIKVTSMSHLQCRNIYNNLLTDSENHQYLQLHISLGYTRDRVHVYSSKKNVSLGWVRLKVSVKTLLTVPAIHSISTFFLFFVTTFWPRVSSNSFMSVCVWKHGRPIHGEHKNTMPVTGSDVWLRNEQIPFSPHMWDYCTLRVASHSHSSGTFSLNDL